MRLLLTLAFTVSGASLAFALAPSPAPVVGVVAGPWGLVAAGIGYGAYRAYKALR
ncbi:MAG: hypothetical protein KGO53_09385 [Alphaproteobacteria bacterium]|nr:hypothetical protein [Alphaproteobacteria bacterium]